MSKDLKILVKLLIYKNLLENIKQEKEYFSKQKDSDKKEPPINKN